jgi:hypothetical protein
MGVAYVEWIFGLSQRCPKRLAGLPNQLICWGACGHASSLIVRGRAASCTGLPGEVRHGAA